MDRQRRDDEKNTAESLREIAVNADNSLYNLAAANTK